MAIITRFETQSGTGKLNPTEVTGFVTFFSEANGKMVTPIKTTGSKNRKILDATSQTLQLREASARQLYDILKRAYLFD